MDVNIGTNNTQSLNTASKKVRIRRRYHPYANSSNPNSESSGLVNRLKLQRRVFDRRICVQFRGKNPENLAPKSNARPQRAAAIKALEALYTLGQLEHNDPFGLFSLTAPEQLLQNEINCTPENTPDYFTGKPEQDWRLDIAWRETVQQKSAKQVLIHIDDQGAFACGLWKVECVYTSPEAGLLTFLLEIGVEKKEFMKLLPKLVENGVQILDITMGKQAIEWAQDLFDSETAEAKERHSKKPEKVQSLVNLPELSQMMIETAKKTRCSSPGKLITIAIGVDQLVTRTDENTFEKLVPPGKKTDVHFGFGPNEAGGITPISLLQQEIVRFVGNGYPPQAAYLDLTPNVWMTTAHKVFEDGEEEVNMKSLFTNPHEEASDEEDAELKNENVEEAGESSQSTKEKIRKFEKSRYDKDFVEDENEDLNDFLYSSSSDDEEYEYTEELGNPPSEEKMTEALEMFNNFVKGQYDSEQALEVQRKYGRVLKWASSESLFYRFRQTNQKAQEARMRKQQLEKRGLKLDNPRWKQGRRCSSDPVPKARFMVDGGDHNSQHKP